MKKILLVDDEQAILEMYKASLGGYEIELARNGSEAIDKANKCLPDLIYLDIIMPEINGLDVLEKLKKNPATKDIPVILLTNLPKEASCQKAMSLGATDYLVKAEVEPDMLVKETERIVGK